jgi:hypothetical protein
VIAELIVAGVTSTVLGSLWLTDRMMRLEWMSEDPEVNARIETLRGERTNHAYPADGQADVPRQPTSSLSFQPVRPSGVGGAA